MLIDRYQEDLKRPDFLYDAAQENAVRHLQRVYDELNERYEVARQAGVLGKWFSRRPSSPVKGLYFWGGVGRGKTYLMDLFFETLPFRRKSRLHFHRFMQRVHRELKALSGESNPLDKVADQLADEAVVICFDEFFVTDITDAMILGNLFEALFARGVALVATSNIIPDRLYENGLQRERFLPAIAMLKRHCEVVNVDSGVDYRLRVLEKAELYHCPLDARAERQLQTSFEALAQGMHIEHGPVDVNNRVIPVRARTDDVLWCDFAALCEGPRSQLDYIELAREYHTVLVGNVPQLGAQNDDAARRFVNMVDEFYDRQVKLVLTAEAPIDSLYGTGRLSFEFQRTRSRLLEMQSHEFLARPHRPD